MLWTQQVQVRDFVFNPDNGGIRDIVYDAWGVPFLPRLTDTFRITWEDVIQVGPAEVIVRRWARGAARRSQPLWRG